MTCGKRVFFTRKEAKQALKKCKRNSNKHEARHEQNIYACPLCHFWHLTSQSKRIPQ